MATSGCSFDAAGLAVGLDARHDGPSVVDARFDAQEGLPPSEGGLDLPPLADSKLDAVTLCSSWTPAPKHFNPCDVGLPADGLSLTSPGVWTYDTDAGTLTDPVQGSTSPQSKLLTLGGIEARVVSVKALAVNKGVTLRATGTRPLVLAVWASATVDGTIDVSSTRDLPSSTQLTGAGANPAACASVAATRGLEYLVQGGGSGGGGFGDDGGDGGAGDSGLAGKGAKGSAVPAPGATVRGGCAGAKGGTTVGGTGGAGGGAVQITARLAITVSGVLHAGGASGGAGGVSSQGGGGGGGSGGYLGLEAPTVKLMGAILAANGGGGGSGASDFIYPGKPGADGLPDVAGAAGGVAPLKGGAGGMGGYKGQLAGQPGKTGIDGGGGGGGGAGHLVITSSQYNDSNAKISAKAKTP